MEGSPRCDETTTLTSNMVCAAFRRPLVALFFSGAARTLAQPLLYHSIRTNLVEAFGGNVTLFAAIKLRDSRGDTSARNSALIQPSEAAVKRALLHIAGAATHTVLNISRVDWLQPCHGLSVRYRSNEPVRPHSREYVLANAYLQQAAARYICLQMMQDDEVQRSHVHDFVVYLRPDVSWLFAVKPFFFWDLSSRTRLRNWVWMFPRTNASSFLAEPYEAAQKTCRIERDVEIMWYTSFPAAERMQQLPALLTRQNRPGMPEVSSRVRNGYQMQFIQPGGARFDVQAAGSGRPHDLHIGDPLTYKNPCANVVV